MGDPAGSSRLQTPTGATMTPQTSDKTWRRKLTLAAITGLVSGAARAFIAWALDQLTSNS